MGVKALVIERGAGVGESWKSRYPTLKLHTPTHMNTRTSCFMLRAGSIKPTASALSIISSNMAQVSAEDKGRELCVRTLREL